MSIQTTHRAADNFRSPVPILPDSEFYSLSSNINISRTFSLLLTLEYVEHSDYDGRRVLTGLIVRF
jgi:hypothetical protein